LLQSGLKLSCTFKRAKYPVMCGSMQESEDMWAPTQESRATPHYCTISVWQTIVIGCFTLWIFQRLIRARGKRNESVKSREAASAPSIDAAECKPHQYDVFINHRGPDVKKSFVAHLNAALRRDGYRPFLDAKSIGQGRHVFNSIDRALKGACIHVAIFSERYAESKYCLNELCDMLNSNHVILPVFTVSIQKTCGGLIMGPSRKGSKNMSSVAGERRFRNGRKLFRKLLITEAFDRTK
jgi:hypothetical protein